MADKKGFNGLILWAVTGVLAAGILAGAYMLSRERAAPSADVPAKIEKIAAPAFAVKATGKLAGTLRLSVTGVDGDGGRLPLAHSCYQKNAPPLLTWTGAPQGTQGFAFTMTQLKDDGAPLLRNWVMFDVPATADKSGEGVTAVNDNGSADYAGPCAPRGKVKYVINLYALDAPLGLTPGAKADDVEAAMKGHILDIATFNVMHYKRLD